METEARPRRRQSWMRLIVIAVVTAVIGGRFLLPRGSADDASEGDRSPTALAEQFATPLCDKVPSPELEAIFGGPVTREAWGVASNGCDFRGPLGQALVMVEDGDFDEHRRFTEETGLPTEELRGVGTRAFTKDFDKEGLQGVVVLVGDRFADAGGTIELERLIDLALLALDN